MVCIENKSIFVVNGYVEYEDYFQKGLLKVKEECFFILFCFEEGFGDINNNI